MVFRFSLYLFRVTFTNLKTAKILFYNQLQLTTMKKVITFTSKFNIGDIVTYDDKITKSFTSKIIDIKFTDSYQYMYKLEGINGIWYTDRYLTNDTEAKSS